MTNEMTNTESFVRNDCIHYSTGSLLETIVVDAAHIIDRVDISEDKEDHAYIEFFPLHFDPERCEFKHYFTPSLRTFRTEKGARNLIEKYRDLV